MADPTQPPAPNELWRRTLDSGDRLEVHSPEDVGGGKAEPRIVLTLRPHRAAELGLVLHRYNRLAAIFAAPPDIWTEESLARALSDAPASAGGPPAPEPTPSSVSVAGRDEAAAILHRVRPELTGDQLSAVVDAAAWWLDSDEDYRACDLLDSIAAEVRAEVHLALLDRTASAAAAPPVSGD